MKNKLVKMMALLTATTMVAAGVMGCGSDSSDASADANTGVQRHLIQLQMQIQQMEQISVEPLHWSGSTSMEKLANAMNASIHGEISECFRNRRVYG